MTAGRSWTHREDERLESLWRDGIPTTTIGAILGRTKSAVIGRASRLGLAYHELHNTSLPADMEPYWLRYQTGEVTTVDIANELGVTPSAVARRFRQEGWQVRSQSERKKLCWARRREAAA